MIQVTRLNGSAFSLNALYIEKVESFPDTTITLTTGRSILLLNQWMKYLIELPNFIKRFNYFQIRISGGEENEE